MSSKVGCLNRTVFYEFYYGLFAMISYIGPGTSIGYSSVALPMLTNNNNATKDSSYLYDKPELATWFASIVGIATMIGCIASVFTMKAGRRFSMIIVGISCALGWIVIATSYGIVQLFIGRFITGFSTGLVSTPPVVYLAEISIPQHRIVMTTCSNLCITIGFMIIYLLGFLITDNWKLIASITVFIPTISAILIAIFMPESPMWLLQKDREEEARKSLFRLRGLLTETQEFKEEFALMVSYSKKKEKAELIRSISQTIDTIESIKIVHEPSTSCNFSKIIQRIINTSRRPDVWKPMVILNTYFFFQQFCGIYVIIAYAVDFVTQVGVVADPFLITALIGFLQILSSASLVVISCRMGTRLISLISGIGITISLAILAIYLQFIQESNGNYTAIPIVAIFIFVLTGQFGVSAIPWSMLGELFPTKYVNVLGPMTTCAAAFFNFITVQIYPSLISIGILPTIYFYLFISAITTIFIALVLPETRGKTNHEIEAKFMKK